MGGCSVGKPCFGNFIDGSPANILEIVYMPLALPHDSAHTRFNPQTCVVNYGFSRWFNHPKKLIVDIDTVGIFQQEWLNLH